MSTQQREPAPSMAESQKGEREPMERREPKDYSPGTILTREEVAEWLDVDPKTVRNLGIKTVRLGHSTVRYLAKHVLEYMEAKAA